jgi:hypothetical protein
VDQIIHKKFDPRKTALETGFIHKVSIPFNDQNGIWWNESCADVLEVFGLPGGRFISHPTMDDMTFYFKSSKDATLCKILLSEKLAGSHKLSDSSLS